MGAKRPVQAVAAMAVLIVIVSSLSLPSEAADGAGVIWKISDTFYGRPAVGPDDTVYVFVARVIADETKTPIGLRAYDADGKKLWEVPVEGDCTELVVDRNGTVYFVQYERYSYESVLTAVSKGGSVLWRMPSSQAFRDQNFNSFGTPAIGADGNVMVPLVFRMGEGNGSSRLCSYDPNGNLRWNCPIALNTTLVYPGREAGALSYIISYSGEVQGISSNGTVAWTLDLGAEGRHIEPPCAVGADGSLILEVARTYENSEWSNWVNDTAPREVWAISTNGSIAWKFAPFAEMEGTSGCYMIVSGVTSDGTIIIGQQRGIALELDSDGWHDRYNISANLIFLDREGKVLVESYISNDQDIYYPVVLTASSAYVFTLDAKEQGRIHSFNIVNGTRQGSYVSPTELWVNGLAAGTGDRLYYFEGAYKGAEQGVISLICSIGLPPTPVPRPLDLAAASLAWGSVIGLAAVGGYAATRKRNG